MNRRLLVILVAVIFGQWALAQDTLSADSSRSGPVKADTMFVIPAGPVAGSFTITARVAVVDTIAGWAKIQVEGWVPVQAVMDRLKAPEPSPFAVSPYAMPSAAVPRQQCEAITKKGTRCSRLAIPGAKYCWQHSPDRKH
ncbi:MAG: hypothetical protein ACOZB3_10140 [Calditrichota bacterium]